MNGPVPTGWLPKSSPYFETAAGDTIIAVVSASTTGNCADGDFILNVTSIGPVASTLASVRNAVTQVQCCFGSSKRLKWATTAAASSGVPSWNLTPLRNVSLNHVASSALSMR